MKRKPGTKVSTPAAKPKKPFVRNVKWRGEIIEVAFLSKAAAMGFAVTKPYGDSEPYDFIVDSGNRLWRVQVKSGSFKTGSAYRVGVHHLSNTKPAQKAYTAKQIDMLAVYIVPVDAWYIIPVLAFTPSTSLAFLPDTPAGYGTYARTYEQFREAWFLMACRRDGEPKRRHRHRAALQLLPFIRQDVSRMCVEAAKGSGQECPLYTDYFLFSILAQASFSATVRLNTGFP